jgi:hypothetical protein
VALARWQGLQVLFILAEPVLARSIASEEPAEERLDSCFIFIMLAYYWLTEFVRG